MDKFKLESFEKYFLLKKRFRDADNEQIRRNSDLSIINLMKVYNHSNNNNNNNSNNSNTNNNSGNRNKEISEKIHSSNNNNSNLQSKTEGKVNKSMENMSKLKQLLSNTKIIKENHDNDTNTNLKILNENDNEPEIEPEIEPDIEVDSDEEKNYIKNNSNNSNNIIIDKSIIPNLKIINKQQINSNKKEDIKKILIVNHNKEIHSNSKNNSNTKLPNIETSEKKENNISNVNNSLSISPYSNNKYSNRKESIISNNSLSSSNKKNLIVSETKISINLDILSNDLKIFDKHFFDDLEILIIQFKNKITKDQDNGSLNEKLKKNLSSLDKKFQYIKDNTIAKSIQSMCENLLKIFQYILDIIKEEKKIDNFKEINSEISKFYLKSFKKIKDYFNTNIPLWLINYRIILKFDCYYIKFYYYNDISKITHMLKSKHGKEDNYYYFTRVFKNFLKSTRKLKRYYQGLLQVIDVEKKKNIINVICDEYLIRLPSELPSKNVYKMCKTNLELVTEYPNIKVNYDNDQKNQINNNK